MPRRDDPHTEPRHEMSAKGDSGSAAPRHVSVLLSEVIEDLAPRDGETYIDGTFGAGGYTRAILEAADCRVLAIEQDPDAFAAGAALCDAYAPRLMLAHTRFSAMEEEVAARGLGPIDGIVLDIGVSSMQLDDPARGFSFMRDGPLDMRMSQDGPSAADFLNHADEEDIANVLYRYGDERRSRAIARAIGKARSEKPLATTLELAHVVERVLGRARGDEKHPATRTFQALRIYINDELGELERALAGAERLLRPGGRLSIVTFHSLEDRIVKHVFQERSGKEKGVSRYLPKEAQGRPPSFRIVNPKGRTPSEAETDVNPRARSARLRTALRTDADPWPADER